MYLRDYCNHGRKACSEQERAAGISTTEQQEKRHQNISRATRQNRKGGIRCRQTGHAVAPLTFFLLILFPNIYRYPRKKSNFAFAFLL